MEIKRLWKVLIVVMFVLSGCSGYQCLKIGGGYMGAEAEIEYCWNIEKSKAAGVPVLSNSEKGDLYAMPEKDILDINKMLGTGAGIKALSITETPIAKLKRLLAEWRAK